MCCVCVLRRISLFLSPTVEGGAGGGQTEKKKRQGDETG